MTDLASDLAKTLGVPLADIDQSFALGLHPAWNTSTHPLVVKFLHETYDLPVEVANRLTNYRSICENVFGPHGIVEAT